MTVKVEEKKKTAVDVAKEYREKNPPKTNTEVKDQKKEETPASPAPSAETEKKVEQKADKPEKSNDSTAKEPELTDAALIETPDEKLTPELKDKKTKLVESKKPDKVQIRINELVGDIKDLKL